MQLIAAARGAINGLMAEVMEDHIRRHAIDPERQPGSEQGVDRSGARVSEIGEMVDVFMGTDSADLYRKIRHSTARLGAFAVAVAIGIAVASLVPKLSDAVRTALGLVSGASVAILSEQEAEGDAGKRKPEASGNELPAVVKLTDDQIGTAGIELAPVQDGTLTHQIIVPGTIVPHADRIAWVSVRLPAMVAELRKMLGEHVDKGLLLRRKEAVA